MNSKKSSPLSIFTAIIIAGIIIGGAIIYLNRTPSNSSNPADVSPDTNNPSNGQISFEGGHSLGNPDAPVVILEYSDFECPFCANFHQTMSQVIKDYPNDIRWVYKHFPLDFHAQARPAAEASECAAEQKEFWGFADGLFGDQERLDSALYLELAQNLELDLGQFQDCVSSRKYKDKVENDFQEGTKNGVRGTPGNFINGAPLGGAVPYSQLKLIVDSILENQ